MALPYTTLVAEVPLGGAGAGKLAYMLLVLGEFSRRTRINDLSMVHHIGPAGDFDGGAHILLDE